ncbi:MAG: M23 family metallopeptidase [Gemmataceae bacterium]
MAGFHRQFRAPPDLTWLDERDCDRSSSVLALTDGGRPPDSARPSPEATPDSATAAIEDVRFSESQAFGRKLADGWPSAGDWTSFDAFFTSDSSSGQRAGAVPLTPPAAISPAPEQPTAQESSNFSPTSPGGGPQCLAAPPNTATSFDNPATALPGFEPIMLTETRLDRAEVRATTTGASVEIDGSGHPLSDVIAIAPPSGTRTSTLPLGMFDFKVHGVSPGGTATVSVALPAGFTAPNWLIQDPVTGALESFDFDGTTGAEIHGNVVTLHYVDGGRGDADGIANGVIADPGGPGFDPANDAIAVWPIKYDPNAPAGQDHKMLTGFGDASPNNAYKFHEGIDILASGQGGEDVVAARPGKVTEVNPDYSGGAYVIEVTLADSSKEWDVYLHIDNLVQRNNGDNVNAYDQLGKISATFHQAGSRHLHYMVVNQNPSPLGSTIGEGDIPETTILNPFLRFKDAANRDPWGKLPKSAQSNNLNPNPWIVAPDGSFTPFQNDISGKVDIIVDAFDPMTSVGTPEAGGSGLFSIGYYVLAPKKAPRPHGVKTSKDTAYILAKFDDNWFPGTPHAHFTEVYADSGNKPDTEAQKVEGLRVRPNPYQFPRNYHYIVTNTKGTDGSVANVSGAQNWYTKAKERATPPDDNVADANYASPTDAPASKNAEARFMDGLYNIVAVLKDLNNTVEISTYRRVANFPRPTGAGAGGQPPPSGSPINTEDPDAVVSFDSPPPTSVAPMYTYEPLGTPIGISGEQFYPNWLMDAYIFPHRSEGWSEGDGLTGALNHSLVLSDSDGAVAVTASGWTANATG